MNELKRKEREEEFIKDASIIHKEKYRYDLVYFVNKTTKVNIICPTHDVFEQTPKNHLNGHGCPYCSNVVSTQENEISDFIENELVSLLGFNKITDDEYELVTYCNRRNTKVINGVKGLFNFFVNENNPIVVIVKIDRRWDNGNEFKNIGFKFLKNTEPNYYYVANRHRYLKIIDTEKETYRIFDSGNSVYEWKKKIEF